MGTVNVLTAERMLEIEANSVHVSNLHAPPGSMVVFGDSYVDPNPPGSTGEEGISKRVQNLLRVPDALYRNESVSGGSARSNRKESCYRTVWDFFSLKRTEGPYTPDCGYALIKFDTNDAVYGISATQKYGFLGALRSMVARAQAGSVYDHNDSSVAYTGRQLLWNAVDQEDYRVNAHEIDRPWGSGAGCVMLETVGETVTITVPADHTGYVDLYFIGAYYGGSVVISVNSVVHGIFTTGGCGIPWYGDYLTDERNGLVYRISGVPSGAATIEIELESLDAGVTGSPGIVAFDSWSIRAADENLPFVQLPEMALPDGGLSSWWSGVDEEDADAYSAWKQELADELNAGLPTNIVAVGVPPTRDALLGFDVVADSEDVDGAGHPPRDACSEFAKIIVDNYARLVKNKRQVSWHVSWKNSSSLLDGIPTLIIGSGSPVSVFDDFEDPGVASIPWVISAGTWTKAAGVIARDTSGESIIYQDTGITDGRITAIQSGAALNNHGLVFRMTDESNYVSLIQSSSFGNWFYRSVVDDVVVESGIVVGPHVDGTTIDVVLIGDLAYIFFDGIESGSSPINLATNLSGTSVGLIAGSTGVVSWSKFVAGIYNSSVNGQLYLDTTNGQIWGPYSEETETFPGPTNVIPPSVMLDRIKTVDGASSGLDADTLDTYHATDIIPSQKTWYAGELAASRPTTATGTQASVGTRTVYWGLVNAADHGVVCGFTVPPGWDTLDLDVSWTPTNTDTGNVIFEASRVVSADGGLVTGWGVAIVTTTDAADGVANTVQTTKVLDNIAVTPGDHLLFCVERNGDDASDTFTGDVRLLTVKATKAS